MESDDELFLAAVKEQRNARYRGARKGGPRPLLHVTDVFPRPEDSDMMRAAAERGHIVHKLCEDFDRGQEPNNVEPQYAGCLKAWTKFLADVSAEVVEIEYKIGGAKYGYVGRLDRVLKIKNKIWVIDIKSGKPWPTHGPQTAAYEYAYRSEYFPARTKPFLRACVHLTAAGKHEFIEHSNVHDLNTFLAYLRIAQFEIEHGLRQAPAERE